MSQCGCLALKPEFVFNCFQMSNITPNHTSIFQISFHIAKLFRQTVPDATKSGGSVLTQRCGDVIPEP